MNIKTESQGNVKITEYISDDGVLISRSKQFPDGSVEKQSWGEHWTEIRYTRSPQTEIANATP